jgi:demethylmenaquinone methyltransferase/2-methoxy-6-polyprenyl-1,4-benzoquinol methylase
MTDEKAEKVRGMFAAISGRYDLLNTLLSLNRDAAWRRFTVERSGLKDGGKALDVATGTGKLAVELARAAGPGGKVVGADPTQEMMDVGAENLKGTQFQELIDFKLARAEELPFEDETFDCSTIAFGLRNVTDIDKSLKEMTRVVRPGGRVLVLEFTQPRNWLFRKLYFFYFFRILPTIGRIISGDRGAYSYLPDSVLGFPLPKELRSRMENAGLVDVEYHLLTWGIVALHVGIRA